MSYTGKVQNGVVVLPPHVHLKEGERVQVTAAPSPEEEFVLRETAEARSGTGTLPDDLAANHDYYLHGSKKQQPRRGRWIPVVEPARELTEREAADITAQLRRFAAETRGLPPDLAANHEYYLHGLPGQ
jgi:hypothetical protein